MGRVVDDAAPELTGGGEAPVGRVARNRQRRTEEFLRAGLRIVTEEGFDALTMGRLSDELDTAIGSVYRYFPSKGHLVTAIQAGAVERLTESHDRSVDPVVAAVFDRTGDPLELVRLVASGRWFCAAAEVLPEEVRLMQMVNARRSSALAEGGGEVLLPSTLALLGRFADAVERAQDRGVIGPGEPLARTVAWAAALGGVLATADLARYLPGVADGWQLARQHNVDLCIGWGADPEAVTRIDRATDEVARSIPLARLD
jgi:AcrR family transcriptional regulator